MLKLLQWQKRESGRSGGRWVLKSPCHLAYVDVLFAVFPGARVIQTHRDPLETIPSAASMYRSLWELSADEVDPLLAGAQVRERFAWALARCLRSREHFDAERFLDVAYADVQRDPLSEIARIYAWLGISLTPDAERAMRDWLSANSRGKRAKHAYTLDEFGYTEAGLAADFAEYREHHILPRESVGASPRPTP